MISKPKGRPGRSGAGGYNIHEAMGVSGLCGGSVHTALMI